MLITDASETAWGGVVVQGPQVIFAAWGQLPPELLRTASLTRELFGLLEFWKLALHVLPQGHARLQVQMDNQGATCLINKTKATTATTLPIMREIHQLQEEHDIHLVVDWRERTDSLVSLVDRLSKLIPPGADIGTTVTTAKLLSHKNHQDCQTKNPPSGHFTPNFSASGAAGHGVLKLSQTLICSPPLRTLKFLRSAPDTSHLILRGMPSASPGPAIDSTLSHLSRKFRNASPRSKSPRTSHCCL